MTYTSKISKALYNGSTNTNLYGSTFQIDDGFWITAGHVAFEFNHEEDLDERALVQINRTIYDIRDYEAAYIARYSDEGIYPDGDLPNNLTEDELAREMENFLGNRDVVLISGAGEVDNTDPGLAMFLDPNDMKSGSTNFLSGAVFSRYGESSNSRPEEGEEDVKTVNASAGTFTFGIESEEGDSGGAYVVEWQGSSYFFGSHAGNQDDKAYGLFFRLVDWSNIHSIIGGGKSGNLTESDPHNLIVGTVGSDTIQGTFRADTILGRESNDIITDGDGEAWGDDTLDGGDGVDTLTASKGNDTLLGGTGNDTLIGGEGDDTLVGGGDEDLGLADGADTVDYSNDPKGIKIGVSGTTTDLSVVVWDGHGGYDTLESIEHIIATGYTDYLYFDGEIPSAFDPEPDPKTRSLTIDMGSDDGDVVTNAGNSSTKIEMYLDDQGNGTLKGEGPGVINILNGKTKVIGSAYDDEITDLSIHNGHKKIDGGSGSDVVTVDGSDATLYGGDGDDTLTGGSGNDILYGDASLSNSTAQNQLSGGAGNDVIVSSSKHDSVFGGSGNDHIEFLYESTGPEDDGAVFVDGGEGDDIVIVKNVAEMTIQFEVGSGHDSVFIDPLVWVDWDAGITLGTRITIASSTISAGDVQIIADEIPGNPDYCNISIVNTSTGDSIDIYGLETFPYPHSGSFRLYNVDVLGSYIDFDNGHYFTSFYDYYNDITFADIPETSPTMLLDALAPPPEDTTGTAGNDDLAGGAGSDEISGGDGDDSIESSGGSDTIDGGDGEDTLYIFGSRANFSGLMEGTQVVLSDETGLEGYMFLTSVERVFFVSDGEMYETSELVQVPTTADDVIVGNALANEIDGLAGIDTLSGMGGDDHLIGSEGDDLLQGGDGDDDLEGGTGADTMVGGDGDDWYLVDDAGDVVTENADEGSDFVEASMSYVLGANIEGLSLWGSDTPTDGTGNALDNYIFGDDWGNTLSGLGGYDYLEGGEGDDILNGGTEADTLLGGAGNDTYYVDNAGDTVIEPTAGGDDTVIAYKSFALGAGQEIETLRTPGSASTSTINLTGNELASTLLGNAGTNTLNGGDGADYLRGYAGDDTYFVDHSGDTVIEAAGGGSDTVITDASYTLGAGQEIETLRTFGSSTTGAINLTGNALANTLFGNASANVLDGKGGADILRGYAGNDTFAFTTALGAGNIDTVVNFNAADDTITIDNAVFAGLADGVLATSAFRTGAAAATADDRIIYNSATGALLFDADGSGAGGAIQFAAVSAGLGLTASDFLVI